MGTPFRAPCRFDVQRCAVHSCEEILSSGAVAFDVAACNMVFGGLPPGLQGLEYHTRISSAATERLLQLLGNAEAVCCAWYNTSSDLYKQLLQLSYPVMMVLLSSNKLQARSENSVLMMADAWVMGQLEAPAPG